MTDQETANKRHNAAKIIGTHSGTFHCDEALAVFLLRQTHAYHESAVKRSRDPAVLGTCDIVVDVGAVYDESKLLFDHHQRGFTEVFGYGFNTKLSSAGLVYKHFGKEVIANMTSIPSDDAKIEVLWLKLYKEFIEAIDAIDNGISQYPADLKPLYRNRTDLSSRVAAINPAWNEEFSDSKQDVLFEKASKLTGEEFSGRLKYYANAWLPARELLVESIAKSRSVESSGKIIVFDRFLPWKEHLFELEEKQETPDGVKAIYVIYPDESANAWRIQAVPVTPESFESRKALPAAWRGLRDAELSRVMGIEGGIFVHASGFIGGNHTKEGAMKMAVDALAM